MKGELKLQKLHVVLAHFNIKRRFSQDSQCMIFEAIHQLPANRKPIESGPAILKE